MRNNNMTIKRWIKLNAAPIAATLSMGSLVAIAVLRGLTPAL